MDTLPGTRTLIPEEILEPEETFTPEEAVGDLYPEVGIQIFKISREVEAPTPEITEIFREGIFKIGHVTRVGH